MQAADRLVRRDEQDAADPLPEQAVGEVEQAGQALPTSARADALISSPASSRTMSRWSRSSSPIGSFTTSIRYGVLRSRPSGSVTQCTEHHDRHAFASAWTACVLPVPGGPCQRIREPPPGCFAASSASTAGRTARG